MSVLDWLVFVAACVCLLLLVRRLVLLSWRDHHPFVIVFHGAMAAACASAAANAWEHAAGIIEVAAIIGATSWLMVSFDTWRHGVPNHFAKRDNSAEKLIRH